MIETAAGAAVAGFAAAVDALVDAPMDGLDAGELTALLTAIEAQRRRLAAVDQRVLSAAAAAGVASACGQPSLAAVLRVVLRIDAAEAKYRVERAVDFGPRRSVTGEPLPPLLDVAATAIEVGELSTAQADVVRETVHALPPTAPAAAVELVQRVLVDAARFESPRSLRRLARELLARLDAAGTEAVEERAERHRAFTLVRHADGTSSPGGRLNAEVTALLTTVLDSLSAPQNVDELPDDRTPAQRRHDGPGEALRRLLRSDTLPAAGGTPVTVLATTTIGELTAAARADASAGLAVLGHGETVSVGALLKMAGDANVVPVIFDDVGGVVAYGRGRRLASRGQRLALAARDGGCTFPGCDRPASWSEVHHVKSWLDGGGTDLDNLCLVCRFHHHSFERLGWAVRMARGRPEWLPPPWLDPDRRPRRNGVRQRPEIRFDRAGTVT